MQKKWKIKDSDSQGVKFASEELGLPPLLVQLLHNRGYEDVSQIKQFLNIRLESLHDPFLMYDLEKACKRIETAIKTQEKVLVYGDYDVDGICSTALLVTVLEKFGTQVISYIPNRIEEGYGLNEKVVAYAKERDISLIITVDCGITGHNEVKALSDAEIDTIITDHHEIVNNTIPNAYAVVDPYRPECEYPFKKLAGVGIVFKIIQGLFRDDNINNLTEYLDLVAMGTVADVVPLIGENRILVKYGLEQLSRSQREGVKALVNISNISNKKFDTSTIGFVLGPRINASGRMGSCEKALELLITKDSYRAYELAVCLDKENRRRQDLEAKILKGALAKVEESIDLENDKAIVLHDDAWHSGVIGIVASRLVERYYLPTILIATDNGVGKGSGRSIKDFHLFDAIENASTCLEKYGGHKQAIGLTIKEDQVLPFRNRIKEYAMTVDEDVFTPQFEADAEVSLNDINLEFLELLEKMAPFGYGNSRPVFVSHNLSFKGRLKPIGISSIKGWVTDGLNVFELYGSGVQNQLSTLQQMNNFSLLYTPAINRWQGRSILQLRFKDIKGMPVVNNQEKLTCSLS